MGIGEVKYNIFPSVEDLSLLRLNQLQYGITRMELGYKIRVYALQINIVATGNLVFK